MTVLRDVIAYICKNYPYPSELSKARLTKMVYLCDWKSCLENGTQITNITWVFNHFGPYVDDAVELAREDPAFEVEATQNQFGNWKEVVRLRDDIPCDVLTAEQKAVVDFIIDSTRSLNWDDFIKLVYSTYPVVSMPRYTELDLPSLAAEYKKLLAEGI